MLLCQLDKLIMVNPTGTNEDHAVSGVVGLDVGVEIISVDGKNVGLGSKDGPAKWLAWKKALL